MKFKSWYVEARSPRRILIVRAGKNETWQRIHPWRRGRLCPREPPAGHHGLGLLLLGGRRRGRHGRGDPVDDLDDVDLLVAVAEVVELAAPAVVVGLVQNGGRKVVAVKQIIE